MAEQQLFLETDLIRQAQNGNNAAYGELYQQHLTAIQHYIRKRVGESCDVEDLTQTVFVKAWQALRDYQPSGAPFRSWLYRIAHNAVVDHYRTHRPSLLWDDLTGLSDPQALPELQFLATERRETVRTALASLRPAYQAVLVRRFLQNLDYSETAADLGQQVNHVRVVQHRALDALRRVLAHDHLLWLVTTLTVMALLLGGKIVVAAEQALPGDPLYPMRTWVEETTLLLADDATDVELHTDFAAQRFAALGALYQQGRQEDMAAAVTAAVAHIRAASTQFTKVADEEQATLIPQFTDALQNQAATLHTLAQSAPQTFATLQPALIALTAAQDALVTTTEDAPSSPTPTPSATATRTLLPTPAPTQDALIAPGQETIATAPAATAAPAPAPSTPSGGAPHAHSADTVNEKPAQQPAIHTAPPDADSYPGAEESVLRPAPATAAPVATIPGVHPSRNEQPGTDQHTAPAHTTEASPPPLDQAVAALAPVSDHHVQQEPQGSTDQPLLPVSEPDAGRQEAVQQATAPQIAGQPPAIAQETAHRQPGQAADHAHADENQPAR